MARKELDKTTFTRLRRDTATGSVRGAMRPANAGSRPSARHPGSPIARPAKRPPPPVVLADGPRPTMAPTRPIARASAAETVALLAIAGQVPPVVYDPGKSPTGDEAIRTLRERVETLEDQINSYTALEVSQGEALAARLERIEAWTEPARAVAGSLAERIEAIEKHVGIAPPASDPQKKDPDPKEPGPDAGSRSPAQR